MPARGRVLERALEGLVAAGAELLICAGDCVDDETAPGVPEDLADLRARFLATGLPLVIVPGNHDPPAEDSTPSSLAPRAGNGSGSARC